MESNLKQPPTPRIDDEPRFQDHAHVVPICLQVYWKENFPISPNVSYAMFCYATMSGSSSTAGSGLFLFELSDRIGKRWNRNFKNTMLVCSSQGGFQQTDVTMQSLFANKVAIVWPSLCGESRWLTGATPLAVPHSLGQSLLTLHSIQSSPCGCWPAASIAAISQEFGKCWTHQCLCTHVAWL